MPADRFGCLRDAEFGSFLGREFPELVGRQPVVRLGSPRQLGSPRPSSAASSSSAGSSSESVPGVIDCGKSLSKLEVRPTSLLLVCSDGTAGLENLTWSHWGHNITTGTPGQSIPSATATGTGEFFLNDCNPNCAQGHDQTYPVQVTLSVVYSSPSPQGGTYFGQASLTWQGNRPPAGTKSTYLLPDPPAAHSPARHVTARAPSGVA